MSSISSLHPFACANAREESEFLRGATAMLVSVLVTACFLESADETPLPHTLGAAAFLAAAIMSDVRWMRIPNVLTFPALAIALSYAFAAGGLSGGALALAGAFAALVSFGAAFAMGWMGAGDVKAMMVLGAIWGPADLAVAAWWMIVAGGLLAIGMLATRPGALSDLFLRWWRSCSYSIRLRRLTYLSAPRESARAGLPFAVAMGLGATCAQIWGSPWS